MLNSSGFWDVIEKIANRGSELGKHVIQVTLEESSNVELLCFTIKFYEALDMLGGVLHLEAVELAYGGSVLGDDGFRDHCFWIFTLGRKAWLTAVLNPDCFYVEFRELMPRFPLTEQNFISSVLDDESLRRFGDYCSRSKTLLDGPRDVFADDYPKSQIQLLFPKLYLQKNAPLDDRNTTRESLQVELNREVGTNLFWTTIASTLDEQQVAQSEKFRIALDKMTLQQFTVFKAYLHFYLKKLGTGLQLETLDYSRGSHDSRLINIEDHLAWIVCQGFEKYTNAIASPDDFYARLNTHLISSTPVFPGIMKIVQACELVKFGKQLDESACPVERHRSYEDAESKGDLEVYREFYPRLYGLVGKRPPQP